MIQKTYSKTKNVCKVTFTFKPEHAETVEILGLNSDWKNSIVMSKKKDGTFSCNVDLQKNTEHQFKYLVDETEWINEPTADSEIPDQFGGKNSVIVI